MVEGPIDSGRPRPPSGNRKSYHRLDGFIRLFRLLVSAIGAITAAGVVAKPSAEPAPEELAEPLGPQPPEVHYPDGRIEHPSVRFERQDVRFGGILLVILGAACLACFHYAIMWWFFNHRNAYEAAIKRSPYPLAPAPSVTLPVEPRLEQLDRAAGIERPNVFLREASKEKVLGSVGPTSEPDFVHIPIDRAMQLVIEHLPAQEQTPQRTVKDKGLLDGGAPNSGRLFRGVKK